MERLIIEIRRKYWDFIDNLEVSITHIRGQVFIKVVNLEIKKKFRRKKIAYQIMVDLLNLAYNSQAILFLYPSTLNPYNDKKLFDFYHNSLGLTSALDEAGFLFFYF